MNRILIPTDFSQNAREAATFAFDYFSGLPCTFFVLNVEKAGSFVMDNLMTARPGSSIDQAIAGDNKKKLIELVEHYREQNEKEAFTFLPLFDYDIFVDAVKQTVKKQKIDLIVMGTNGATGARETLFGSNTLQVIRSVDCPILAIPEGFAYSSTKRILLSIIDGICPSEKEIAVLKAILSHHKPTIHVLSITQGPLDRGERSSLEQKVGRLLAPGKVSYHYLDKIPVPMAIKAFVQLESIDMHALHIEKRSFLDRFIYGSHTSGISYQSEIPLLVLNSH